MKKTILMIMTGLLTLNIAHANRDRGIESLRLNFEDIRKEVQTIKTSEVNKNYETVIKTQEDKEFIIDRTNQKI